MINFLLIVSALLTLPTLYASFSALVKTRATDSSSLVLPLFLAGNAGAIFAVTTGSFVRVRDVFGGTNTLYGGHVGQVSQLCVATCACWLVASTLRRQDLLRRIDVLVPILASIIILGAWGDLNAGYLPLSKRRLVLLLVILSLSGRISRERLTQWVTAISMFLVLSSVATALLDPIIGLRDCRLDKCTATGFLLTGSLGNENGLGLSLAATLPFVGKAALPPRVRLSALASVSIAIYLTGSRTALSVTIAVLSSLLWIKLTRRTKPLQILALLFTAFSTIAPWLITSDAVFTGRPELWRRGLSMVMANHLLPLGYATWASLGDFSNGLGTAATYSLHNQTLDVLFGSGGLGLALFLSVQAILFNRAQRDPLALSLLLSAAVMSLSERPWSLSELDWLTWTFAAYVFYLSGAPQEHSLSSPPRTLIASEAAQ